LIFVGPSGAPTAWISEDEFSIGTVAIEPAGISIGSAQGARFLVSSGFIMLSDPKAHTDLNIWPNVIRIYGSDSSVYLSSDMIDIHKGQGLLALNFETSGNPSLLLADEQGRTRAQLGAVDLKETGTGNVTQRSPASLVPFNENGRVLWEAP
jgi:hypothetical protein